MIARETGKRSRPSQIEHSFFLRGTRLPSLLVTEFYCATAPRKEEEKTQLVGVRVKRRNINYSPTSLNS